MKKFTLLMMTATLFVFAGCKNDPAEGKHRAVAEEAAEVKELTETSVQYAFSNDGSEIEFVGAKVTGKHDGEFKVFSGTIDLVNDDITQSRVNVTIQMDSMVADEERLTGHLKSDDFFDVENHPTSEFVSTAIVAKAGEGGTTHEVTGNLTIRGVTKSITFPAKIEIEDDEIEAEAEFAINRKDFNITYPGMPDDLIKDQFLLKLALEAKKKS